MQSNIISAMALCAVLTQADSAFAQYKNSAFGLDAGWMLITKPSSILADGSDVKNLSNRPLRLQNYLRFGGEYNFKMDADRWWISTRLNFHFSKHPSASGTSLQAQYDREASSTLGTVFGLGGQLGVRYFFQTDRFRPYAQLGLSYDRLFPTSDLLDQDCSIDAVCDTTRSNRSNFLTHPNVGGVHFQPGVEMLFQRDMGIHVFVDVQRWIVINATDNWVFHLGVGMIFYS